MCIINRDVHQFIGHCPIPSDPLLLCNTILTYNTLHDDTLKSSIHTFEQIHLESDFAYKSIILLAVMPLEAYGALEGGIRPPPLTFNCSFKKERKNWGEGVTFFSRGYFSWEGVGTLPQNSYKPSQDL